MSSEYRYIHDISLKNLEENYNEYKNNLVVKELLELFEKNKNRFINLINIKNSLKTQIEEVQLLNNLKMLVDSDMLILKIEEDKIIKNEEAHYFFKLNEFKKQKNFARRTGLNWYELAEFK